MWPIHCLGRTPECAFPAHKVCNSEEHAAKKPTRMCLTLNVGFQTPAAQPAKYFSILKSVMQLFQEGPDHWVFFGG